MNEEPYYNNFFGTDGNKLVANVTALATSNLPPETPKREVVSWCVERADSGGGFAIFMPLFYKNWLNEELRRCILNGIVLSAKREVPFAGVQTTRPELTSSAPVSIEPHPFPAQEKTKVSSTNSLSPAPKP